MIFINLIVEIVGFKKCNRKNIKINFVKIDLGLPYYGPSCEHFYLCLQTNMSILFS